MARRKLSMNEYLEMVYQWHRGRSVPLNWTLSEESSLAEWLRRRQGIRPPSEVIRDP